MMSPVSHTAATSRTDSVPASPTLQAKLAALRARHLGVLAGTGLALAIIICLELLALLMFADWWLDFPWTVRLLLFLVQFGIFNWILFQFVFHPYFRPPDDETLALQVEKTHPELKSRLISSVQFAKPGALSPGASAALALSTIEQTEAMTSSMDFRRIVSLDSLQKLAIAAAFVLFLTLGGLFASRAVSADLIKRAFLSNVPVPRKTRIDWISGDLTIGRGDTIVLEAQANGVIPKKAAVTLAGTGRRDQTFEMESTTAQPSHFTRSIANLQEDFTYRIQANDAVSPAYTVRVVPRPAANQVECEQFPPAYTGLKPSKRSPGDLSILAGSTLKVRATATKDLRSATLRLFGTETRTPIGLNPANLRELKTDIFVPAKALTGFTFELVDSTGMKSAEGTVYRIDILPDKAPQSRITWPERKEELLTRLATLVVGFDVTDDFAIRKVALKYRISTLDTGTEKSIEMSLDPAPSGKLRRRYEWKFSGFQPALAEGSIIEYWIEAEDNNDVTGPGTGKSEHQLARIVSENDKRADLLNRAGDSIGILGDVTLDQEKLNRSLGTLILERTGAR